MLSQEKRINRKREDAEANANADGRHAGVSDNNVVHFRAEAHATQSTDRIEQRAGSSEGVKKIKEKHSTTEFVNIERKDDERNVDDDAQAERCRVLAHYLRGVTRRIGGILFTQLKM